MKIDNTVCLITGGATGIGKATCLELARRGSGGIVVNFLSAKDEASQTVAEICEVGCDAIAIRADVTQQADIQSMVAQTLERFGQLDVLVNNAATTKYIAFPNLDQVTDEVWNKVLDTNVRGAFYCSRAAASALRASKGSIVNISSISAVRGSGSSIPYAVSKAALLQLTRSLALALAPEVSVNAVLPGFVDTSWHERGLGHQGAEVQAAKALAATPLGRLATPHDIAEAVASLLTAGFATGQALIVDGGRAIIY